MKRNFSQSLSILLLLAGCLFSFTADATSPAALAATPQSMKIVTDWAGHWFLDSKLEFGCEVAYSNGGKRRTAGYLNGNLPWREFNCESAQANFDNGVCYVDMMAVARNHYTVVIEVQMLDYPLVKTSFTIKVPPLTAIGIELHKGEKLRYGNVIEPLVSLTYANGVVYVHQPASPETLIPSDSIDLFFNQTRILDGRMALPDYTLAGEHSFTASVLWKSKPWINDVKQFSFEGKDDCEVAFNAANGKSGANQAAAPVGMDGVEGYYGMKGLDGTPVELHVYLSADATTLHVDAQCGARTLQHQLNPEEASYTLAVRGGKGGKGGSGGDGGHSPWSDPYAAGIGGKGGRGGQGGKGSAVKIICSSSAQRFLPCIIIDNSGGEGGPGGKGGRGGAYANVSSSPTLGQLLFPSRNYPGEIGDFGDFGESGGEAVIEIED